MTDIDAEVLEAILDPSTHFLARRKAFEQAMTLAWGTGWDACHAAYQEMHGPIEGPAKPDGIVEPQPSAPVAAEPERTWTIEERPVVDGHATLPDGRMIASDRQVVRVPVLRERS